MNVSRKPEEQVIYSLRELYGRMGYTPFKMSKFEAYDLYMQNKDFLVSDGVITFTDTDGTLMALKPDVTLSIVKNFRKDTSPLQKVYYSENVYRRENGQTYREIMQAGLECLGDVGSYELCEVILLAARSLNAISSDFVLDISHMQIVTDILEELSLSYEEQAQVLQAIACKNEDALSGQDTLLELLQICGPMATALEKLKAICKTEASANALVLLEEAYGLLKANGLEDHVQLDFSIVNDMNYYNGIVFRGYVAGIPVGVLSGGQYDKLMTKMEKNAGGVGFAVYLDQLERLDTRKKEYDVDTVLLYDRTDDITQISMIADTLSREGNSVLLLTEKPKALRYRRLMQIKDGRAERIENNG